MLKDQFNDILRDYGHNVLVVKQGRQLRCSCWNEVNKEVTRTCPVCFGLGTVPTIEKHTTRTQMLGLPEGFPRALVNEPFGQMVVPGKHFYFKHDIGLKVKDLIVEVDWSPTGKPIYVGGDILEINFIDPKRFETGQVAYVKVYCKGEPVRSDVRGIRIASANGIKNYEIVGGSQNGS